jgi:hypothetical protein
MSTALSEEVRTAVVPPPLCRDCRWCRPAWGVMIFPFYWPIPLLWRQMWGTASCRHPTSLYQRPKDFVTGSRGKPRRMDCNWARSSDYNEKCGPQARYWEARPYPAWLWPVGPVAIGLALVIGYVEFLRYLPFKR